MKTKISLKIISLLLLLTTLLQAAVPPSGILIADATPAEIIDHFSRVDPESPEQNFTLALAYFGTANFRESIDYANRALFGFENHDQIAVCHQLISQAYAALGDYERAAVYAHRGQHYAPDSKDLAALRVVYFSEEHGIGDPIMYQIADEHLRRLDADYKRDPKMEPLTASVIIIGIVCVTMLGISFAKDDLPKDQMYKILSALAMVGANLAMLQNVRSH